MLKIFTFVITLCCCSAMLANTSDEKPFQFAKAVQLSDTFKELENPKADQLMVEHTLPDAILRLYQLERIKFTGGMIYTHKPLELANIKNPVKTV